MGDFVNPGTLTFSNSIVSLHDTITTAQLITLFGGQNSSCIICGTLDNSGATLRVGPGAALSTVVYPQASPISLYFGSTIHGGTIVDTGDGLDFAGATLDEVTYDGTLDIRDTIWNFIGDLHIAHGLTLHGVDGTGNGTINVAFAAALIFDDTQTIDHATINLRGEITAADTTDAGSQVLTLGSSLTINAATGGFIGSDPYEYGVPTAESIVNMGAIDVTRGTLTIDPTSFTNTGKISALGGASLSITAAKFTNASTITASGGANVAISSVNFINAGTISVTGGGSFDSSRSGNFINAGSISIASGSTVTFGAAAGHFTNAGSINATGDTVTLNMGGFIDAGTVAISNSTINVYGALITAQLAQISGTKDTINLYGTLNDSGAPLTVGIGTSFTIDLGGVLNGHGAFAGALTDNGEIEANGGLLTIGDAITGSATANVDDGASLELGAADAGTVTFAGSGALILDSPENFTGTLSGFVSGDIIALRGITAISAAINATGKLSTIKTASGQLTFNLAGSTSAGQSLLVTNTSSSTTISFAKPPLINASTSVAVKVGVASPIALSITESTALASGQTVKVTLSDTNGLLSLAGASVTGSGTDHVLITGSLSAVNSALATLTDTAPTGSSDKITITAIDSRAISAAPATIAILPPAYVSNPGGTPAYQFGGAPVAILPMAVVLDAQSATLSSATIAIQGGFTAGDLLSFTKQSGITGAYTASTGVLKLSGSASLAAYQAAIRSVTFSALSYTASESTTRSFAFNVTAGTQSSNNGTGAMSFAGPADNVFNVTSGNVRIVAGAENDTFYASANSLVAGQVLDGGGGYNILDMIGGGTFNLAVPATLANFQFVGAVEGTAVAGTYQTIDLGPQVSHVIVGPGYAAGGIVISGGYACVIELGEGTDTVNLGSASESIDGNGGHAIINATATTAAAWIEGFGGTTKLNVTGGGTVSLNQGDQDITEVDLNAASTPWTFAPGEAMTIMDLSTTADTLTGSAGDIFYTGAGPDTLVFHAGFGKESVFSFSASGAGHDVLQFDETLFADWAHLLSATTQQGSDLLIALDPSDTVLLKNVALASFVSADAKFA